MATLVAHVAVSSPDNDGMTSAAIDTTGATLLVLATNAYVSINVESVSDSKSNTWVPLTPQPEPGAGTRVRLFYVANPTVGSGHTFTQSAADTYSAIAVTAWSGVVTPSPFDVENGASISSAVTSIQHGTGGVTPSAMWNVVIAAVGLGNASFAETVAINGGFTISDQLPGVTGTSLTIGMAYLLQSTWTAANPTWTWTNAQTVASAIAVFESEPGGGPTLTLVGRSVLDYGAD